MSLRDELLGDDAIRGEAYEALVLDALELHPERVDIRRAAKLYREASGRLVRDSAEGAACSRGIVRALAPDEESAKVVWALIYGARTFQIAHKILTFTPPAGSEFTELGAGLGPFALRAALCPGIQRVVLVDRERPSPRPIGRLYGALGLPEPSLVVGDARRFALTRGSSCAVPNAFREMGGSTNLVEKWLQRLAPGGMLYVVEPGSRPVARGLMRAREDLKGRYEIGGPCRGAYPCPKLRDVSDWCHFTWRVHLGPIGRRIAAVAGRRWQDLHASWVTWKAAPPLRGIGDQRQKGLVILENRSSRREAVVQTCSAGGEERWSARKGEKERFRALQELQPGELVTIGALHGACRAQVS